ncbi:MAG: GlsB/YeaQ/YmgE family stress response membrane protein [Pirellulales bacterium]|nr:GlsB/YeaQ/YmgE family stress response membrane protein [Pirellulales bacterium]
MPEVQVPSELEHWANVVLVWIGFGTLVGLAAKAIMPGRDPGGAVTTLLMGIGGSVIGSGVMTYFWEGQHVTPLSPLGFAVAVGGSFLLLFFYRLLAGHVISEGVDGRSYVRPRRRVRRYRDADVLIDE